MTEWITGIVEKLGYWAIALLMLLENVFPPIPSEVIMPLAGYTAADGGLNLALVILSGTLGTVAGAAFWWWLAGKYGERRLKALADRHGRWLTLSADEIDRIDDWFDRHGSWAIPLAHVVPGLRTLISIPAGMFGTRFARFIVLTTSGSAVWNSLLAGAGYLLGKQFSAVDRYLGPAGLGIMGAVLLYYIYRVITFRPSTKNA
ncbi:DedA family protein (plasmid) [Novosphingobium resinovorum]|jgi:membrane protein DedA with SNARE-associated domain|uniref:DedA family protein n=1 Tax=Novosphingobium TaxID=165696 RepID=UPI001B3C91C0|nr:MULTISPECIES: DedA family protein [Novosphingobium]MBF7015214.1 DedA family protein [Novosphingobium sp. HR1a]WJM29893.1 DedA family protein [Novosphingobium resinovorum]